MRLVTGNERGVLTVGPAEPLRPFDHPAEFVPLLHAAASPSHPKADPDARAAFDSPGAHARDGDLAVLPASGADTPLALELAALIAQKGLILDEIALVKGPLGPRGAPSGSHVWVASKGRETPESESRTYFELHLVNIGGGKVLFTYTNSILQGFLDAFYIERLLETLERPEMNAGR